MHREERPGKGSAGSIYRGQFAVCGGTYPPFAALPFYDVEEHGLQFWPHWPSALLERLQEARYDASRLLDRIRLPKVSVDQYGR